MAGDVTHLPWICRKQVLPQDTDHAGVLWHGSYVAWLKQGPREIRVHVIEKGDTLSELSLRYRVSLEAIRKFNKVRGDTIKIGQKLRIPAS